MTTIDAEIRYSIVPEWVADHEASGLSAVAVRLYAILDRYGNSEGAVRAPSRKTLARRCGVSLDTVDRAKAELVEAGALEVRNRRRDRGDKDTNEYLLRRSPVVPGVAAPMRPPSRTDAATVAAPMRHDREQSDRDTTPTDVGVAAPIERLAGFNSQALVGAYVDACREHGVDPPGAIIGRVAGEVAKLRDDGSDPAMVKAALEALAARDDRDRPGLLPHLLMEVQRRRKPTAAERFPEYAGSDVVIGSAS